MFIEGSLLADYLLIGVLVLVVASFVAGFLDAVAGGAGLILVPAFILTGMPPQLALGQEKLVSTLGTFSAIYNYFKNSKIIWKVVGYGIPTALIGAYIGGKVILSIDESIVGQIIFFLIP
ncbi:sulfite exporter TauE/SafE family protein, partial [thiotrophic endosymbiont of Bathymodiolus puteoserpentis (Logatchev)]|uniref:sulfite exporter TauE/SafE family protein n=1 Tax=thiotrophic endosymbiont of Bathymodiolus puteoserpentis (Logatchev) TaxID=343240 RepID=UPI0015D5989D